MTDFARLIAADKGGDHGDGAAAATGGDGRETPIRFVGGQDRDGWFARLSPLARALAEAAAFRGEADRALFVPAADGHAAEVFVGLGDGERPGRWTLAAAVAAIPPGRYRLAAPVADAALHGWLLAQHRFGRYRRGEDHGEDQGERLLLVPGADAGTIAAAVAAAASAARLRDMVDTPAEDMGPTDLEREFADLAASSGGRLHVVRGDDLLTENFPTIHAVGRASPRAPRLLALDWGQPSDPLVAIVGKGVCFDSGGLDLKSAAGMLLMKKDMGGAAHALALARLVVARRLPIRLRLVVAAVDNVVSGGALRPGDVLTTRKGLAVEVGNTDAEGRLVLADALSFAGEARPDLVIDYATLTGAARVALGPDIPAMFASDEEVAAALVDAAGKVDDPLWRLPLWQPYRRLFRSTLADCNNVSDTSFAGSIIAALFLQQFVPQGVPWAHFDLYAWYPENRPGRPKGAAAMAIFATLRMLEQRFCR